MLRSSCFFALSSMARVRFGLMFCILVMLALFMPAGLSGCAGEKARANIGPPTLVLASTGLQADVERGIATLPADDRPAAAASSQAFFQAVSTKDVAQISTIAWPKWPAISSLATAGIDARVADGTLSKAASASLYERVKNYGELIGKVANPP